MLLLLEDVRRVMPCRLIKRYGRFVGPSSSLSSFPPTFRRLLDTATSETSVTHHQSIQPARPAGLNRDESKLRNESEYCSHHGYKNFKALINLFYFHDINGYILGIKHQYNFLNTNRR